MEAIILAGGKAERLGDAAEGRPKALVPVAGHPLAEYQVAQLVAAGVDRVIVSCAAGQGAAFAEALDGLGAEIVARGGARAARPRRRAPLRGAGCAGETGPLYAFNGDELLDVDLASLLGRHRQAGAAATIAVAPLDSHRSASSTSTTTS